MTRRSRQLGSARRTGFTLLEMLLATAIAAMIAASLYAAMHTAFRARAAVSAQLDVPRKAALILDAIEQQFQSGIPATADTPFVGYSDEVDFYTINRDAQLDDQPLGEGQRWVAIFFRDQQNSHQLVEQVERNLLAQVDEDPEETVLSSDVRSLALRYYDGTDWQTEWDSTDQDNQLPRAVEVTIELDRPTTSDPDARYRMTRIMPLAWNTPVTTPSADDAAAGGGS